MLLKASHNLLKSFRTLTSTPSLAQFKPATASFSAGSDEAALTDALKPLLTPTLGGRWKLTPDGEALERSFKFKTFAKAWDFMTAVSLKCKIRNHHPQWTNTYTTVFIHWTTHDPKGLSKLDINFARLCDSVAKDFGELEAKSTSQMPSQTEGLAAKSDHGAKS